MATPGGKPPLSQRCVGFVTRVGGMLLRPVATLDGVLRGGRGGLVDLLLVLALQLLAVQLRGLVAAVWFMLAVSYTAGMSSLLNIVAQSVLYPVVGVFAGTVLAGLLTRGRPGRGRNADLVALCAVPPICLDLVLTLIAALGGWRPGGSVVLVAAAGGALWFVVLLGLAVRLVRGGVGQEARR